MQRVSNNHHNRVIRAILPKWLPSLPPDALILVAAMRLEGPPCNYLRISWNLHIHNRYREHTTDTVILVGLLRPIYTDTKSIDLLCIYSVPFGEIIKHKTAHVRWKGTRNLKSWLDKYRIYYNESIFNAGSDKQGDTANQ